MVVRGGDTKSRWNSFLLISLLFVRYHHTKEPLVCGESQLWIVVFVVMQQTKQQAQTMQMATTCKWLHNDRATCLHLSHSVILVTIIDDASATKWHFPATIAIEIVCAVFTTEDHRSLEMVPVVVVVSNNICMVSPHIVRETYRRDLRNSGIINRWSMIVVAVPLTIISIWSIISNAVCWLKAVCWRVSGRPARRTPTHTDKQVGWLNFSIFQYFGSIVVKRECEQTTHNKTDLNMIYIPLLRATYGAQFIRLTDWLVKNDHWNNGQLLFVCRGWLAGRRWPLVS